ncbi:MAG: NAD-dependent epimerase/dehydratase family protein, partial [Pirellulales bacterium]
MRKIVVTGSNGLVGWHTRCRLSTFADCQVVALDRQAFNDDAQLQSAISGATAIIHLAAVNRGTEQETEFDNPAIAARLIDALEREKSKPHLVYSSTIHAHRDVPYGRGKKNAGEALESCAKRNGGLFTNFILPHIFGEHGRPNHNSVVSTFAWQLANEHKPSIAQDGQLNLMHAQQAAQLMIGAIESRQEGVFEPQGVSLRVSELLNRLQRLSCRYQEGVLPNVDDPLDLRLFNTYRSYLPYPQRAIPLELRSDNRGHLFETIRSDHKGQVFVSSTHPGITRGNHFHTRKIERFVVVEGQATIRLRRLLTDEIVEYEVRGDQPVAIDIPTLHTHNITNTG